MTVYLSARIARARGVEVLVSLDGSRTEFVESGEDAPQGILLRLSEDAQGELRLVDPERDTATSSLAAVFATLAPADYPRLRAHLLSILDFDNRLDLEDALLDLSRLLRNIARWWRSREEGFRVAREDELSALDPELVALLHAAADHPSEALRDPDLGPDFLEEEAGADPDSAEWDAPGAAAVLGEEGLLAGILGESFEARAGQVDMAERIAKVLEREEHLMIEAGTGIGKSLAYLVPLLLHAARGGERAVVSTYTRTLQSQLFDQDLPLLHRLGWKGKARLLLGRNNYLCRRQLRRALIAPVEDADTARARFALALWSQQSREGRREELSDHPWFVEQWQPFFESVEPCSPHICHRDPVCFVVRARRAARDADVVVVNHSLLMMDLKSAQSLVGPAQLLVVDEAHHLPEVATRGLSYALSRDRLDVYHNLVGERHGRGALREVLANLARAAAASDTMQESAQRCDKALDAFLQSFERWFAAFEASVAERLGEAHDRAGTHRIHDGDEAFGALREHRDALLDAARAVDRQLAAVVSASGDIEEEGVTVGEEREGLASLLEFHREFTAQIEFCLRVDDEDWVYWVEWGGERGLRAVVAAPLTVEEPLAGLWDRHYRTVVMTSATLTVERDFMPFAESVGFSLVDRFTDSLLVPSPFAAEHQTLILTSLDLLEPNDPEFPPRVAAAVAKIASSVETKILVLSTSYRMIDALEEELQRRFGPESSDLFETEDEVRPQILVQRPGAARAALADRFRRADAAILLATGSFWEGVDFPGRQLEVLVVPRLPFAVPTDPLVEGRSDRARRLGRDPFESVSLVDAILRLKQGIGRLLRTREDRGAVLLLDHRLQSRSYGARFLNSLSRPAEIVSELDEVAERTVEFLRRGR